MKAFVAVLLTLCIAFSFSTSATADEVRYINGYPDTFLRQDASTTNPYLERMPYGASVTYIYDYNDEWCVIEYYGQYGFCKKEFLQEEDPYDLFDPRPYDIESAFGTSVLRRGNDTPRFQVMNLQACLIDGGYLSTDPGIDGYFGKDTEKALIAFQKDHNLKGTGVAGDLTKAVLWHEYQDLLELDGWAR